MTNTARGGLNTIFTLYAFFAWTRNPNGRLNSSGKRHALISLDAALPETVPPAHLTADLAGLQGSAAFPDPFHYWLAQQVVANRLVDTVS